MSFSNDDVVPASPVDLAEDAVVLYKYRFNFNTWKCLRLPDSLAFSCRSLLATHDKQLILYGE